MRRGLARRDRTDGRATHHLAERMDNMEVVDNMEVEPTTLLELPEELIGLVLIASGGVAAARACGACSKLRTIANAEVLWASICTVAGLGGTLLADAADHNRGGAVDWRRLVQLAHRAPIPAAHGTSSGTQATLRSGTQATLRWRSGSSRRRAACRRRRPACGAAAPTSSTCRRCAPWTTVRTTVRTRLRSSRRCAQPCGLPLQQVLSKPRSSCARWSGAILQRRCVLSV